MGAGLTFYIELKIITAYFLRQNLTNFLLIKTFFRLRTRKSCRVSEKNVIKKNDKVVIISTAHGLKFVDSKIDYHLGNLSDISSTFSNLPIDVDNSIDKVLSVLDKHL